MEQPVQGSSQWAELRRESLNNNGVGGAGLVTLVGVSSSPTLGMQIT